MCIAYFSNHFAVRNGHGLARYGHNFVAALRRARPDVMLTPVATWSAEDENGKTLLTKKYGLQLLPWGRLWTPFSWTFLNWPPIEHWLKESIDLVHVGLLGYYPIATRKPCVMTIHDIGPLTHPEFFSNTHPWIMKRTLRRAIDKMDAFICVSQATADELESYTGSHVKERIHVIHEGVAPFFLETPNPECLASLSIPLKSGHPFILTAGKISPRKNVARTIWALSKLIDTIPHHLLVVGGTGWDTDEVLQKIKNPVIGERIHLIGYVSDEQLRALYSSASLYIHPSLFEGFGLPILEAMAAGCPVVTSNLSSMPEVAGDAALLVDPYNVDAIAEAIHAICTDSKLAEELSERGRDRAKKFTWERCAEQVANVYQIID